MDLDLFLHSKIIAEKPNVVTDDVVSSFSLQKLFKEYKKKKKNRPLQLHLKEIIVIEKNLTKPEFSLSHQEKQQLFS